MTRYLAILITAALLTACSLQGQECTEWYIICDDTGMCSIYVDCQFDYQGPLPTWEPA